MYRVLLIFLLMLQVEWKGKNYAYKVTESPSTTQSGKTQTAFAAPVHEHGEEALEPASKSCRKRGVSAEKRLIKTLMTRYRDMGVVGRPVCETSDTINVQYGIGLVQRWTDILLQWDPAQYNGVEVVRIPAREIWTPDIVLYNYADERLSEHRTAMAVVNYTGSTMWIPPAIFKSSCQIDITNFPFDQQTCKMKFGSWTYDGNQLNLSFYDELSQFEMGDYMASHEWQILGAPAKRNVKFYPCCAEPYPDLTFTLNLQRKGAFYNYILILPCVLLSTLTLVLFWLPPESPAKMVLGMNIFVAFFLLLLLLADSTPPAASSIPLIGAYYCLNMILITLSTFLSVFVINLYFRGDRKNRVPYLIKMIMIDGLARMLRMRDEAPPRPDAEVKTAKLTKVVTNTHDAGSLKKAKLKTFHYSTGYVNKLKRKEFASADHIRDDGRKPIVSNGCPPGSTAPNMPPPPPQYTANDPIMLGPTVVGDAAAVQADLREIKRAVRLIIQRFQDRENSAKVQMEWRLVALVLDRLFFFSYLLAIIVSLVTIFPKNEEGVITGPLPPAQLAEMLSEGH